MLRARAAPPSLLFAFLALAAKPAAPQAIPTGSNTGRAIAVADE